MKNNLSFEDFLKEMQMEVMGNTIYILDDCKEIRRVIRKPLENWGYKCLECVDGQDFMNKFNEIGNCGLVITDLIMPNLNGVDVIRSLEKYGIPCIAVTACPRDDDMVLDTMCLQIPIIFKPIDNKELRKCVIERFGEPKTNEI